MKFPIALACASTALLLPLAAQEATPKPARKTMTFPSKAPAAEAPKAAAVTKTPEKPAPPKTTPKPAEKATPKPAEKAPEKPVEVVPEKAETPAVVTSTVPPEPSQIARAFFGLLGEGNVDAAYAELMKGSSIAERPDEVKSLKNKTRQAIDLFGRVHGYDLVELKPVGERLMRTTYISLGHQYPLRWRFYFYKAEDDWRLIDIRVDDKLNGIFEEAIEEAPRPEASR